MITVIIPVYNVEKYLTKCVDSVLNQTCRDLEVILVDDGSPDDCPALCDAYGKKDPRVRVIHRDNGGLSAARNTGLSAARGSFIGFVDSDDWVAPDMYERLLAALLEHDADIAVCNFSSVDERKGTARTAGASQKTVLEHGDATRFLLEDDVLQNYVWNKLYDARLWTDVRFPAGQTFEDINTTYKVFEKARRCVLLPDVGYYYLVRRTGIVQSRSIRNKIDCVRANLERLAALSDKYPECRDIMTAGVLCAVIRVWSLAWTNRDLAEGIYREELRRFAAFSRQNARTCRAAQQLGVTGRLILRLLPYPQPWAWFLSNCLYHVYLYKHPDR